MARASHFRAVSCKRGRASARKRPVHPALENAPFAASEIALPRFLKQILKPNPSRSARRPSPFSRRRIWRRHAKSEEHTSELKSLLRHSYDAFFFTKQTYTNQITSSSL